jgi:hypothetical protein
MPLAQFVDAEFDLMPRAGADLDRGGYARFHLGLSKLELVGSSRGGTLRTFRPGALFGEAPDRRLLRCRGHQFAGHAWHFS